MNMLIGKILICLGLGLWILEPIFFKLTDHTIDGPYLLIEKYSVLIGTGFYTSPIIYWYEDKFKK